MMAELPSKEELIIWLLNNDLYALCNKKLLKRSSFGVSGKTLLHLAARYCTSINVLDFIVNKLKVQPFNCTIQKKRLAIHIACKYGNLVAVQILLESCPKSLNQKDYQGNTPLAVACKYQHVIVCDFLLEQGAKICTKNKENLSPLELTAKNANIAITESLAQHLDSQVWGTVNLNCLVQAASSENQEFVSYMLKKVNFKETCTFNSLFSVLKACKNVMIMKVVLEFIKEKKCVKQVMMLELKVSSELILEYCQSELRGNALGIAVLYDREDLVQGLYRTGMVSAQEILAVPVESLKSKCQKLLKVFKRWQQTKGVIFVKKYCKKECINRLPLSLIRQLLTYI